MSSEKIILTDVDGLSTREALRKLKSAIKDELDKDQVNFSVWTFCILLIFI